MLTLKEANKERMVSFMFASTKWTGKVYPCAKWGTVIVQCDQ